MSNSRREENSKFYYDLSPMPANPKTVHKYNYAIPPPILMACTAMRTATPHPMYPKVPILLLILILGLCADGDSHPPSRVPTNAATLVSSVGLTGSNATSQREEDEFLPLNSSTPLQLPLQAKQAS